MIFSYSKSRRPSENRAKTSAKVTSRIDHSLGEMYADQVMYAATSQLFRQVREGGESLVPVTALNLIALAALSLGLLGQAIIATWSLISSSKSVLSWSSNPLNNTLALLHENFEHETGRCMLSVHQSSMPSVPWRPEKRQKSALHANPLVRHVLYMLWVFAVLSTVGVVVVICIALRNIKADTQDTVTVDSGGDNVASSFVIRLLIHILFACVIQGGQTMGLHAVELLINMSSDERAWRMASKNSQTKGAQISSSILNAASLSWENIVLFVAKAVMHWLLGQSIPGGTTEIYVIYTPLLVYGILVIALAIFATYLALRRPSGPQPATWGHFQTLANIIDDWKPDQDGNMWWGDKGINSKGVRHAGTSGQKSILGPIQMKAEYAGRHAGTIGGVKVKIG
jgi:hypothetical protein